jgi:hypothetical protein
MEDGISYDFCDDFVWKVFWISEDEITKVANDYCFLYVFAGCVGTKVIQSGATHEIRNYYDEGPDGIGNTADDLFEVIQTFKCYERFSYSVYQWSMFEFSPSKLHSNQWNRIAIADISSWTENNLRIGIDKTYGGTPNDPNADLIHDFDRSFWYSNYDPQYQYANPSACHGEVMIKLETCDKKSHTPQFPSITSDNYWTNYYPYQFIPIDWSDDKIILWVQLGNVLGDSDYSRLYIYGYSWLVDNPNPSDNTFKAVVNGHDVFFDPDILWARSQGIGMWNWVRIPNSYLLNNNWNYIMLTKSSGLPGDGYKRHNLAVPYFPVDNDRSAWYWYQDPDHWGGDYDLDPTECYGEVAMFLDVYKKTTSSNKGGGFQSYENIANDIIDGLGWGNEVLDQQDNAVNHYRQGYFSSQKYNGKTCGDDTDLVVASAHGEPWGIELQDNTPGGTFGDPEGLTRADTKAIGMSQYGYVEIEEWGGWRTDTQVDYYYGLNEDGFNADTDYILLVSCWVLRGVLNADDLDPDGRNPTCPWQYLLYHGTGVLMGYIVPPIAYYGDWVELCGANGG